MQPSLAHDRLAALSAAGIADTLPGSRVGLEKESLRVAQDGWLSRHHHPRALGSSLTNPYITTDYSEALLEFITPPCDNGMAALKFLDDVQRFTYQTLEAQGELLWATSMPCLVSNDGDVPVARYGHSNMGRMKMIYRLGLGHRYGRIMQIISGVHFNYSFSDEFWRLLYEFENAKGYFQDFVSRRYMGMVRNLQRYGWLVPYLFGASPAVCQSFLQEQPTDMEAFDAHTYYYPYATSLRMGDIGYTNSKEDEVGIKANYDSVQDYADSLQCAISTPYPPYEDIGVVVGGQWLQLNANILQIENEYYSTVRPKQPPKFLEMPSLALKKRGVAYVELRSLDVNAFEPLGVNERQVMFLEVFMLYCVLQDSPCISECEREEIDENFIRVAHQGRKPGLTLRQGGGEVTLHAWGHQVLGDMLALSDFYQDADFYRSALLRQRDKLDDAEKTPSARMLKVMRERGEGFHHVAKGLSKQHEAYFQARPLSEERQEFFAQQAAASHQRQFDIESESNEPFSVFLKRYFQQG